MEKLIPSSVQNKFALSEITILELKFGAYKSDNEEKHLQEVHKIQSLFSLIPIVEAFDTFAKEKVVL